VVRANRRDFLRHRISGEEAKALWNKTAESALKGEDLAKFMKHLEEDE
jgi:hypothetical protein